MLANINRPVVTAGNHFHFIQPNQTPNNTLSLYRFTSFSHVSERGLLRKNRKYTHAHTNILPPFVPRSRGHLTATAAPIYKTMRMRPLSL